jgi:hypothetical protein
MAIYFRFSADVNILSVLQTNNLTDLHLVIKNVTISDLLILSSKNMSPAILRTLPTQTEHAKELHELHVVFLMLVV